MTSANTRTDRADGTDRVRALLTTPSGERDEGWRGRFLAEIADARVVLTESSVSPGPDGLPYGRVHLAPVGSSQPTTTVRRLADRATEKGYGIVVSATPGTAGSSWVFRYGDLWSLRAYGSFQGDGIESRHGVDDLGHAMPVVGGSGSRTQVIEAAPSESVFPLWARHVVGKWLFDRVGVVEPRAKLFLLPDASPRRNLVFNVDLPPGSSSPEHAAMKAIAGWFLPPGLGLFVLPPTQAFDVEPSAKLLDEF